MIEANDVASNSARITLTRDERSDAVIAVENLICRYSEADVLCILMTVTANAIHVTEDKGERKRIEEAYIKAFRFLSAVEEQFHREIEGAPPDWVEEQTAKMMRQVFGAIGSGFKRLE